MHSLIKNTVKEFYSTSHIIGISFLFSFAWIFSMPPFDYYALYSSLKLLSNYNAFLYSIGFCMFVLSILNHLYVYLINRKVLIIAVHLTEYQIISSLLISYVLVFNLFYVLPAYLISLIQQLFYSPHTINFEAYILEYANSLLNYILLWITLSIIFFLKLRNVFSSFITILILYASSFLMSSKSGGAVFDISMITNLWLNAPQFIEIIGFVAILILLLVLALIYLFKLSNNLFERYSFETYSRGILQIFYSKLKFQLSAYHSIMMGYQDQKIIMAFSGMGFGLLAPLLFNSSINVIPMFKIFMGFFVPFLFGIYQSNILQLDINSKMVFLLSCKQTSYAHIIFNRLFLLLLPQLILILLVTFSLNLITPIITNELLLYLLFLNVFHSMVKLLFITTPLLTHYSNFIIIAAYYLFLREDVQIFMNSNSILRSINLASPIVASNNNIDLILWITLLFFITTLFIINYRQLNVSKVESLLHI